MKKLKLIAFSVVILLSSCKKQIDAVKVNTYPTFTLNAQQNVNYTFDVFFYEYHSLDVNWGNGSTENYINDDFSSPSKIYNQSIVYNVTLMPHENTKVTGISLQKIPVINIDNFGMFSNINFFRIKDCKLTNFNVQNLGSLISNIDFSYNNLSINNVSNILIKLESNNINNGRLDISNQTPAAPLNSVGLAAKTALLNRGWTVITD